MKKLACPKLSLTWSSMIDGKTGNCEWRLFRGFKVSEWFHYFKVSSFLPALKSLFSLASSAFSHKWARLYLFRLCDKCSCFLLLFGSWVWLCYPFMNSRVTSKLYTNQSEFLARYHQFFCVILFVMVFDA